MGKEVKKFRHAANPEVARTIFNHFVSHACIGGLAARLNMLYWYILGIDSIILFW